MCDANIRGTWKERTRTCNKKATASIFFPSICEVKIGGAQMPYLVEATIMWSQGSLTRILQ